MLKPRSKKWPALFFLFIFGFISFQNCSHPNSFIPQTLTANFTSSSQNNAFTSDLIIDSSSVEITADYFGYWGLGMAGVDSGNDLAKTSQESNIVFLSDDDLTVLKNKMDKARKENLRVILMVENVFYKWRTVQRYDDWKTRWDNYNQKVVAPNKDLVLGYYLYDEPLKKYVDLVPQEQQSETNKANFYNGLRQVAQLIKNAYPSHKLTMTYSFEEFDHGDMDKYAIFPELDWVGVNCYVHTGCSNPADYLDQLAKKLSAQHRLMLTLDAFGRAKDCSVIDPEPILTSSHEMLKWANQRTDVAAITPFIYQEVHTTSEDLCGTSSLPTVKTLISAVATEVLKRHPKEAIAQITPQTTPSPSPTVESPPPVAAAPGPIIGWFQSPVVLSNGWLRVEGWACSRSLEQSVAVDFWVGNPAGSGTYAVTVLANRPNGQDVQAECWTKLNAHRFIADFPPEFRNVWKGKSLYVYGIHPNPNSDADHKSLGGSGVAIP